MQQHGRIENTSLKLCSSDLNAVCNKTQTRLLSQSDLWICDYPPRFSWCILNSDDLCSLTHLLPLVFCCYSCRAALSQKVLHQPKTGKHGLNVDAHDLMKRAVDHVMKQLHRTPVHSAPTSPEKISSSQSIKLWIQLLTFRYKHITHESLKHRRTNVNVNLWPGLVLELTPIFYIFNPDHHLIDQWFKTQVVNITVNLYKNKKQKGCFLGTGRNNVSTTGANNMFLPWGLSGGWSFNNSCTHRS